MHTGGTHVAKLLFVYLSFIPGKSQKNYFFPPSWSPLTPKFVQNFKGFRSPKSTSLATVWKA